MTFMFTEEQLMIQGMARQFSRKVLAATAMERDRTGEFPAENLKKMGKLGYMGMMIPTQYDGKEIDTLWAGPFRNGLFMRFHSRGYGGPQLPGL